MGGGGKGRGEGREKKGRKRKRRGRGERERGTRIKVFLLYSLDGLELLRNGVRDIGGGSTSVDVGTIFRIIAILIDEEFDLRYHHPRRDQCYNLPFVISSVRLSRLRPPLRDMHALVLVGEGEEVVLQDVDPHQDVDGCAHELRYHFDRVAEEVFSERMDGHPLLILTLPRLCLSPFFGPQAERPLSSRYRT